MRADEISYEEFQQFVEEDLSELVEKAASGNIDVTKVLLRLYEEKKDYEVDYVIGAVKRTLENELKHADAKQTIGVIAGLSDTKGKNMPIRATFFPAEGKPAELTVGWKRTVQKNDGTTTKIIAPAILDCATTESAWTDRNGITHKDVQIVVVNEIRKLEPNELIDTLEKMNKITNPDDLMKCRQGDVVATKVTIRKLLSASKWVDDESIPMSIWQQGDRRNSSVEGPAFTIFASTPNGATVKVYVSPPGKVEKTILIPQIKELCQDAINETDDPQEQAEFLDSALNYKTVVVAGRIFNVNPEQTERSNGSISIAASSIVLIPRERKLTEYKKPVEEETAEESTEEESTPTIEALKDNIYKVINFKARHPVTDKVERVEILKKMTMEDLKKFKVNEITIDGKKQKVDWTIVDALAHEMVK